jgi:hypothetical protein
MDCVCDVVLEDSRDVFLQDISMTLSARARAAHLRKPAFCVADQETRLSAPAITDNNELLGV